MLLFQVADDASRALTGKQHSIVMTINMVILAEQMLILSVRCKLRAMPVDRGRPRLGVDGTLMGLAERMRCYRCLPS